MECTVAVLWCSVSAVAAAVAVAVVVAVVGQCSLVWCEVVCVCVAYLKPSVV